MWRCQSWTSSERRAERRHGWRSARCTRLERCLRQSLRPLRGRQRLRSPSGFCVRVFLSGLGLSEGEAHDLFHFLREGTQVLARGADEFKVLHSCSSLCQMRHMVKGDWASDGGEALTSEQRRHCGFIVCGLSRLTPELTCPSPIGVIVWSTEQKQRPGFMPILAPHSSYAVDSHPA